MRHIFGLKFWKLYWILTVVKCEFSRLFLADSNQNKLSVFTFYLSHESRSSWKFIIFSVKSAFHEIFLFSAYLQNADEVLVLHKSPMLPTKSSICTEPIDQCRRWSRRFSRRRCCWRSPPFSRSQSCRRSPCFTRSQCYWRNPCFALRFGFKLTAIRVQNMLKCQTLDQQT